MELNEKNMKIYKERLKRHKQPKDVINVEYISSLNDNENFIFNICE